MEPTRLLLCSILLGLGLAGPGARSAPAAATEGSVKFTVTLVPEKGPFAPRHYLAVWVTDAEGKLVRTLKACAKPKRVPVCLKTWAAAKDLDAISGATIVSYAAPNNPVEIAWDGRDAKGDVAPDGEYRLRVEFSEGNHQGPVTPPDAVHFSKGPAAAHAKFPDLANFKAMALTYTPR
jgi:hypothetical protein